MSVNDEVVELESPEQKIEEEAAYWFGLSRSGDFSAKQKAEFAQWRLKNESHAKAYKQLELLWQSATQLSGDPDIMAAIAEIPMNEKKDGWKIVSAIAATLLLTVISVFYLSFEQQPMQSFATLVGEIQQVEMEDGSIIVLDGNSEVKWRYDDSSRELRLVKGRARFNVAKNPNRPFTVAAEFGAVTALGTVFDVQALQGETAIRLIEGRVRVEAGTDLNSELNSNSLSTMMMEAGHEVYINQAEGVGHVKALDSSSVNSWVTGRLEYNNTPLTQVIEDLNRHLKHPLRYKDKTIGELRLSGSFNAKDPDSIIEALQVMFPIKVIDNGNTKSIVWKQTSL